MTGLLLVLLSAAQSAEMKAGAVISFPPHLGLSVSPEEGAGATLSLPWVLQLWAPGDAVLRPDQLVIEPGAVFRQVSAFTARLGLRWLRPVREWLALGAGGGMGVEVGAAARAVSSLELVARFGKGPFGFGLLTTRAELRVDGSSAFVVAVGGTYW